MNESPATSVLVVEDERIVAFDIQQAVRHLGYDAYAVADSADEALRAASARCPDVVLMDIRIRGNRDGIETAALLRERFGVPIVFLTAHADRATIERAKLAEPLGYLVKPIKSGELHSAIELAIYRHRMERRLRERERWFSTTLRSIGDAVITVDLGGNVTFMNPVAETMMGVPLSTARGRPAREVVRLVEAAGHGSPMDRALEGREVVQIQESVLAGAAEQPKVVSESAAPVLDQGELLGAVMVFRDITERKSMQRQLELADRLVSLGTMAAGVAHEVNNPLAVVVANAAFVEGELSKALQELEEADGAAAHSIRRLKEAMAAQSELRESAARIGRIVADLKNFSRPSPQAFGRANVVRTVEWAIRATTHELAHRARLEAAFEDVPDVALDETRLGQIVVNLLVNAAQAIEPGNVAANRVAIAVRRNADGRVVVEVRDSGCGIPVEARHRVFEPFFTTKQPGVGTGLGLSICHGIVTSVGGSLQFETEVGHGSVFRLLLPEAESAAPSVSSPIPCERLLPRRARILVIDDESMIRKLLTRVLEGHEVVTADNAALALNILAEAPRFDVILSDLMMPEMTGVEFYERLLARDAAYARRVVFMTGGAVSPLVLDFMATVKNKVLEKPFDIVALRATVQEIAAYERPEA